MDIVVRAGPFYILVVRSCVGIFHAVDAPRECLPRGRFAALKQEIETLPASEPPRDYTTEQIST